MAEAFCGRLVKESELIGPNSMLLEMTDSQTEPPSILARRTVLASTLMRNPLGTYQVHPHYLHKRSVLMHGSSWSSSCGLKPFGKACCFLVFRTRA